MLISESHLELIIVTICVAILVIYIIFKIVKNRQPVDKKKSKIETTSENGLKLKLKNRFKNINKKRELALHDKITKDDFNIFKNVKILIADDNIINQKVITSLLSTSGVNVVVANNGQEVLDILKTDNNFSIIFMDLHMPILDGYQASKSIKENSNYNHIPIIALSGNIMPDEIKKMQNIGIEAYLQKPLNVDAFYDTIYMYTTGKENDNNLEKVQTKEVDLDIENGLKISGNDKEFYLEILHDFLTKYSDSADILQEYINMADCANADKLLLDILGVSANIGAKSLQEAAIELKESINNPNNLEYIDSLKKYKRSLKKACDAIKEYNSSAT